MDEWPLSKNAEFETPPEADARKLDKDQRVNRCILKIMFKAFDYNAKPDRFYFEAETVGSLAPEEVVAMAMKTLVDKLAYVQMQIQEEVETREPEGLTGGWNF
ncbi:hypothetical protein CLU79DRAFT_426492 [Phycomyces nitens]|nr:hypothetical protein CLU79DRAFT_426492 [Phycomyces nitens]